MIKKYYHGKCHAVYLVFVLGFMLPKWTVPLQQFVEHTPKREPISTRVVSSTLRQDFWSHITVGSPNLNQNIKNKNHGARQGNV